MTSPNEQFKLTVRDIELIEHALGHQISKLTVNRRNFVESTIVPEGKLEPVIQIDAEITEIRELLGRIHNQKNWYRPKNKPYVSG